MLRFVLLSFFFLGWAFYEVSGGTDFVDQLSAEKAQQKAEAAKQVTPPATIPPAPEDATVTRAIFDTGRAAAAKEPALAPRPLPTRPDPIPVAQTDNSAKTDAPQTRQEMQDIRQVAAASVNMRNGPSTRYNVILRLPRGTQVQILQEPGNGWVKLKVSETGRVGWMAAKLLTRTEG